MDDSAAVATTTQVQLVGYDMLTPLLRFLFGDTGIISFISIAGIVSFFGTLWTIYAVLAYLVSLGLLYGYVYATAGMAKLGDVENEIIKRHEAAFQQQKSLTSESERFAVMQSRIESDNPNDWKLAIIEADIILDQALKKRGYAGNSLGERLKSIAPTALASLDDAWQAHKIRNYIAHGGEDFILTQKLARETMVRYNRVFDEFGID